MDETGTASASKRTTGNPRPVEKKKKKKYNDIFVQINRLLQGKGRGRGRGHDWPMATSHLVREPAACVAPTAFRSAVHNLQPLLPSQNDNPVITLNCSQGGAPLQADFRLEYETSIWIYLESETNSLFLLPFLQFCSKVFCLKELLLISLFSELDLMVLFCYWLILDWNMNY